MKSCGVKEESPMNLTTAIDRFARQLAADGRSKHTRAAYRRDLGAPARRQITATGTCEWTEGSNEARRAT